MCRCGLDTLLLLFTLAVAGCIGDSSAASERAPARLDVERETVVINGRRPVRVPAWLTDSFGVRLPNAPWRLSVAGESAVRASDDALRCVGSGDAVVTIAVADLSRTILVRCRLIVSFGFPPELTLELGGPPARVRVRALGPAGVAEPLLAFSARAVDSSVARIQGEMAHPVGVGRTDIVVDFGGIKTRVTANVLQTIAADTVRLSVGEFRSWSLTAGLYEISVVSVRAGVPLTTLAIETSGATCSRNPHSEDVVDCLVREHGGVGVRSTSVTADRQATDAIIRITRVQ